jgi:hypothetical protein
MTALERYVARLKEEREVLEKVLEDLESEAAASDDGIDGTASWIEQVKLKLAKIDVFLKAAES